MHTLKNIIKSVLRLTAPYRLPFLLHTTGRRFPVNVSMSAEEAEAELRSMHPDAGGSCLCHNRISTVADLHVIIPVYNAGKYLKDCLDSVFGQKTRFSFFVSIIDDGSTDESPRILDEYLQNLRGTAMFDRTEVLHQSNEGPSIARNRALDNIRGRYITFVDSDDMLLPGAIESLMSAAMEQNADIAEGNTNIGPTHGMACGKVYSAELFRTLHFPPKYVFEDTINIFFLYPSCQKRIQVPGAHYFYRNNAASIMHSYQGNVRAIDSLWVSRHVLADYFASGHQATEQLFADYLQDALSTATAISTLGNERALQATFAILSSMTRTYFAALAVSPDVTGRLPYLLRHTSRSLAQGDYRRFRVAMSAMCPF